MAVTLQASASGLKMIDEARKKKGWEALAATWSQEASVSPATLKRFREKKPIQREAFISICRAVGIEDWEKITEKSDIDDVSDSQKSEAVSNILQIQNLGDRVQRVNQAKGLATK